MINVSQDFGQLLPYLLFARPHRPPAFMAHSSDMSCVRNYTHNCFIYFFKFVWFPSNSRAFVCSLLQSEYDGKWVSNKYRCGRKCQVCLFILIENVSFCLHIKKKWLLTESSLFLESFDLLPWSFAMSYGYVSTDAWGRGADETWTLPQCSNDHSVFCSESSLWITPSFLTLLYLILFFFYPLYWFCIFDFPAYFIALPL